MVFFGPKNIFLLMVDLLCHAEVGKYIKYIYFYQKRASYLSRTALDDIQTLLIAPKKSPLFDPHSVTCRKSLFGEISYLAKILISYKHPCFM